MFHIAQHRFQGSIIILIVFLHLSLMNTIRVFLVLSNIFRWTNELVDVKGAFLCGNFQHEKPIYMKVLKGFEQNYSGDVLLLLLRTIFGLKQAARAFWWELTAVLHDMGYLHLPDDPCLYYSWMMTGLVIWLTWIDDCLITGDEKESRQQRSR